MSIQSCNTKVVRGNSMRPSKRSNRAFSYGWQSRPYIRRFFESLAHPLITWRRRRALKRTHIQLKALTKYALFAPDDISRDYLIVSANALLGNLQARGIITLSERRRLASEWVEDYVRGCLPELYREKNAEAIDRLGRFLKAS
jgi:hypothetical protein